MTQFTLLSPNFKPKMSRLRQIDAICDIIGHFEQKALGLTKS
jgi:hypothetical protein